MENTTIDLENISPATQRFLAMPAGVEKNIAYYKEFKDKHETYVNYAIKDGKRYFTAMLYTVKRSGSRYFLKKTKTQGFTINEKGKLSIWYNSQPAQLLYLDLLFEKVLKYNWITPVMYPFLTKGLLEKILTEKITNQVDFFNAWLKAMRIKGTGKYITEIIKGQDYNGMSLRKDIIIGASVMTDLDHYLQAWIKHKDEYIGKYHMRDIIEQASMLDLKINPNWSDKRMAEEHTRMTHMIMDYEVKSMENTVIPYKPEAVKIMNAIPGVTLLNTKRLIYAEGKTMSHCIYTNYYNRIVQGQYLCFNVTTENESGTLTLLARRIRHDIMSESDINDVLDNTITWKYDHNAFYGKRNCSMSDEAHALADKLIQHLNENLPLSGGFMESLYKEDFDVSDLAESRNTLYQLEQDPLPF